MCGLDQKSAPLPPTPQWGRGYIREKIILKVRLQNQVGNYPTKSDFDFGRRTCRLCAIEGSFIQKQLQHFSCVHTIDLPLVPVFSFWDLRVQDRAVLSDVLALFLSDFFHDVPIPLIFGVVKHIEVHSVAFTLCLCQNAVLTFRSLFNSDIVFRNPHKHISTLAYVNDLIVQLDAVNSCVFILRG